MISEFTIGSTAIGMMPIPTDPTVPRRQRERETVALLLRRMLAHEARLTHAPDGAPLLEGYNISISHSRELAVVALDTMRRVGIDAEEIRPQLRRIKERFLSPAELQAFTTDNQLLTAWTAKEAVFKIVGSAAVEFRTAISVSPDMNSAECLGRRFAIHTADHGSTRITLAYSQSTMNNE